MISVSSRASSRKTLAMHGFLCCGLFAALLIPRTLAAQTARSDLQNIGSSPSGTCDALTPDMPHSDALRKVCLYAVTLPLLMPNFTCEQKTSRYFGDQSADVVTANLTYEDGRESYQNIKLNGRPITDAKLLSPGTWSTGQFASDVRDIFDTSNPISFQFVGESKLDGRRVLTFQYQVAHQDVPMWRLHVQDQVLAPPYNGQLRIDEDHGILLQLQLAATKLSETFPMSSADLQIDYEDVLFADGTSFVLPLKSEVNSYDHKGRHNRNVLEFRNCHKFRATARIVPQ
jgi:hypothetical protein